VCAAGTRMRARSGFSTADAFNYRQGDGSRQPPILRAVTGRGRLIHGIVQLEERQNPGDRE
jgi:hypothetical protein